jgi:hypothetical protein
MNKLTKIVLIIFCLSLFFSFQVIHAQSKYAQAGMTFLKIGVGARAALGGTQLGIVGDAESMFANPAGLAALEGFEVISSMTNWIADIKHYGIGAAYNWGSLGTFGVSVIYMDNGEMIRTIPYDGFDADLRNQGYENLGPYEIDEYAIGLSYARKITSQFYVGGQLKYAKQDLGHVIIFDQIEGEEIDQNNSVSNMVLDFGTVYYPGWKDFRFGVAIRQFANQSDYYDARFELPLTFDFGIAMNILELIMPETINNKLTLAMDWVHPRDYARRQHVGLEYAFQDLFFLRGGYKFNYDEEGLTAGLGVRKDVGGIGLKVDYVYSDFGIFDSVSRFTVGIFLK